MGRTLDYERSFGEQVVVTPRRFPLRFRHGETLEEHYALVGMAHVAEGWPLYYDAVNEMGLGMAGLLFPKSGRYGPPWPGWRNAASFELIPWVLARCATAVEARELLAETRVTAEGFSPPCRPRRCTGWRRTKRTALPPSPRRRGWCCALIRRGC